MAVLTQKHPQGTPCDISLSGRCQFSPLPPLFEDPYRGKVSGVQLWLLTIRGQILLIVAENFSALVIPVTPRRAC